MNLPDCYADLRNDNDQVSGNALKDPPDSSDDKDQVNHNTLEDSAVSSTGIEPVYDILSKITIIDDPSISIGHICIKFYKDCADSCIRKLHI